MATTPTIADVQRYLNSKGFGPLVVDGEKGPATTEAVSKFQKDRMAMDPPTGILDPVTLAAMFPEKDRVAARPLTIQATIQDYVLNFVQSKIVWAAGALVALAVTWINTRFGFRVPAELENWVTSGIITLGAAVIAWLRTRGTDTSRIASVAPSVILDPTKWK